MRDMIILISVSAILSTFMFVSSSDSLAGDRLRTLYIRTDPSEKLSVTKFDVRIVKVDVMDQSVCVVWHIAIESKISGRMPLSIDFYDKSNGFIGRYNETMMLDIGMTTLSGQKCLHCPEYFPKVSKVEKVHD